MAAALSLMLSCPATPAAFAATAPAQLADLLRAEYGFVDADGDGIVTKVELQRLAKDVSSEQGLPLPADQLDFSYKLFDLNQDGTLTTEELLRALVIDAAVSEDAVDADVFAVFDTNRNGTVESSEWSRALGDLGQHGDGAKEFVFSRVDSLSESAGSLNSSAFANALQIMRSMLLGT